MDLAPIEPSGEVAVFPLPNTVFFPETALPLHVFEPRYRAMVRDVSRGNGRIAVTLLRPGWESDYHGRPAVHDVATVGRVVDLDALPDGRFNLRLVGLARVRLHDDVGPGPYRVMRYRTLPERPAGDPEEAERGKVDLLATQLCVAREIAPEAARNLIVDPGLSLAAAVNGVCSSLPLDPAARQRLLEVDDLAERRGMAAAILERILGQLVAARDPDRGGDPGGPN